MIRGDYIEPIHRNLMSVLIVEQQDTLKTLYLNRPQRANALNAELVQSLGKEIEKSANDGTRTLVLRGHGNSFSSGFDLQEIESLSDAEVASRVLDIERMLQSLFHAPMLTVALVHSKAFGAGADLVCCCHRRIATQDSRFCMPGLNFGILLGTRRLTQRVGSDNALSVLTSTRVFEASEALAMGYLTQIASSETWPEQIESAKLDGEAIAAEHVRRMFKVVIPDTRNADIADLESSVKAPGLVERILEYRDRMRASSGKKPVDNQ